MSQEKQMILIVIAYAVLLAWLFAEIALWGTREIKKTLLNYKESLEEKIYEYTEIEPGRIQPRTYIKFMFSHTF